MQKTCIIIPCYNEADRLPVNAFAEFYSRSENFYFCFVNDGSRDNTSALLREIAAERERVIVIDNAENAGKSGAIRSAVLQLAQRDFDYLAYFDADFSTPLEEIDLLLAAIATPGKEPEMAFGSRIKRIGTEIHRTVRRHIMGRVFSTIASLMLKLPVYDTQCGAKLFKTGTARLIFEEPFVSRWLFDIELFARMVGLHGRVKAQQLMIEVPLTRWEEVGDSRLRPGYLMKVPVELLHIYTRYRNTLKKK